MASKAKTATFEKPATTAAADRKGKSTVDNPVGVAWVTCLNLMAKAGSLPARKEMHVAVMAEGVAYYTTRTQVQRFRKWVADGADQDAMPRGITIS